MKLRKLKLKTIKSYQKDLIVCIFEESQICFVSDISYTDKYRFYSGEWYTLKDIKKFQKTIKNM